MMIPPTLAAVGARSWWSGSGGFDVDVRVGFGVRERGHQVALRGIWEFAEEAFPGRMGWGAFRSPFAENFPDRFLLVVPEVEEQFRIAVGELEKPASPAYMVCCLFEVRQHAAGEDDVDQIPRVAHQVLVGRAERVLQGS